MCLTSREMEVLRLLVTGLQDKEIAALLKVSPRTIRFHISHIFEKSGVFSRSRLIARFGAAQSNTTLTLSRMTAITYDSYHL
jgi:LuxR family maltose regulon positive regulatory protein